MPAYKNVTLATPLLSPSQIQFRLGLVRQRTRTYLLDSMDFIMIDLERPEGIHPRNGVRPCNCTERGQALQLAIRAGITACGMG